MKRGEVYYIERVYNEEGSEQRAGRPAIIVSNDTCNEMSPTVEVVYLTTQSKNDLPTHVDIRSTTKSSIALCEQISTVSKDRIGDYMCMCTDYEMLMVDAALAISLGLTFDSPSKKSKDNAPVPAVHTAPPQPAADVYKMDLIKLTTERDTYKQLYEQLLGRLIGA